MRHLQSVLCISLVLASVALGNTQPEVTNVMAVQRPHTALVDVTFDLFDADGDLLHVTLWYSLDGGGSWDHQCMTVWGDVGPGIVAGEGLSATWDAGVDLANHVEQQFWIRVYADDGGGSGEVPEGFVYIPPGTFMMGSPTDEPGRHSNETQHQVTLTQGFYMSRYEVTEEWWYQVMGGTPTTSQLPQGHVSCDLAVQFCNALSLQEGLTPAYTIHGTNGNVTWDQGANGYRLPTEAEWEYACRATTTMAYHNDTNCLDSTTEANFRGNTDQLPGCPLGIYRGALTEVGSFPPNQWGLYDMHGNLFEWVWCGPRTYTSSPQVDPMYDVGPGAVRVVRGGAWDFSALSCRSAGRGYDVGPAFEYLNLGIRPVRSAP